MSLIFFFNDTATTEIYTLSLHDALPISAAGAGRAARGGLSRRPQEAPVVGLPQGAHSAVPCDLVHGRWVVRGPGEDRKSTRLNSSHANISYAVFCLKKKNVTRRHKSTDK